MRSRSVTRVLLPAELAHPHAPRRRTPRDWSIDVLLFAFAVFMWAQQLATYTGSSDPAWMTAIDPWAGGAACLALWWRRRFPLALTIAMVPVLFVSASSLGAVLVMILTLAVHRAWPASAVLTGVFLALAAPFAYFDPQTEMSPIAFTVVVAAMFIIPLCVGVTVRARRQLFTTLRREAALEREEYQHRLQSVRQAERHRIAREMHDVLAHRLSLLSVHAGALAYRQSQAATASANPMDATEVAEAIEVIQSNARQALSELAEVLTVLRTDEDTEETVGLTSVRNLIEEARAVGQPVELAIDIADSLPPQLSRTIHRIVQEGLTNARKHAPGQPVSVKIAGTDAQPTVEVRSRLSHPRPTTPASGFGLIGLAERIRISGGTITTTERDDHFILSARLE
ncbi:signal transduction histidine kinase [Stackebrandtia endophytica]|uniref:histidine kinase n=1 Tax=Stackebrandtia endophytica TaxID=1496996 RepID=A0A543AYP1_9ACTN|nr:histidine kinase [Stackebrandtia endophytica]TQL77699.1 signal transduction histidine kinase [Stackebrandtia endophytica]